MDFREWKDATWQSTASKKDNAFGVEKRTQSLQPLHHQESEQGRFSNNQWPPPVLLLTRHWLYWSIKNLHSTTYKAQADTLRVTCTSSSYPSPFSNQSRLHHPPGPFPSTPFGFRSRKRNGKRFLIRLATQIFTLPPPQFVFVYCSDHFVLLVMANPTALLLFMDYGFKFRPSDEECFSKYLVPKTRGDIMKGFPIEDVNLCEHEPRNLPGNNNTITSSIFLFVFFHLIISVRISSY